MPTIASFNWKNSPAPSVIDTTQPERELRLATAYWLNTIQPYIAGRRLRGAEWYIAMEQHSHLRGDAEFAKGWNEITEGKKHPVPPEAFPDWTKREFQEPEQLLADGALKPEILAGIAASLGKAGQKAKTPIEAVQDAHELLLAAERYIGNSADHG